MQHLKTFHKDLKSTITQVGNYFTAKSSCMLFYSSQKSGKLLYTVALFFICTLLCFSCVSTFLVIMKFCGMQSLFSF